MTVCHWPVSFPELKIILPVGISFYTFQTMSYTIDVYRGKINPTSRWDDFALYVAFFPQLVAGPIERASRLLPQIQAPRRVTAEHIYQGGWLIFWGLFQKVFVADNMAILVDRVFSGELTSPLDILMGVYAFAFQIYGDFAGYSNIARGLASLMGFKLMTNFRTPYFSASPSEFWRRWHISLSTWLKDYLYIPLGGNRGKPARVIRNLLIVMVLGGLWHGAAWHFVVWGLYQGVLLGIYFWAEVRQRKQPGREQDNAVILWSKRILFFHFTCFGWMIFRAASLQEVAGLIMNLTRGWEMITWQDILHYLKFFGFYLSALIIIDWGENKTGQEGWIRTWPLPLRSAFYTLSLLLMIIWGQTGGQTFIYFQF